MSDQQKGHQRGRPRSEGGASSRVRRGASRGEPCPSSKHATVLPHVWFTSVDVVATLGGGALYFCGPVSVWWQPMPIIDCAVQMRRSFVQGQYSSWPERPPPGLQSGSVGKHPNMLKNDNERITQPKKFESVLSVHTCGPSEERIQKCHPVLRV